MADIDDKGFMEPSRPLNADRSVEVLGALSLRVEMVLYPPLNPVCTASPDAGPLLPDAAADDAS